MSEAVSDILDLRMRESDGLARMAVISLVLHGALLAGFVLMPAQWGRQPPKDTLRMTISFGGAPGPDAGGMTQMSGAPVQAVAPPEPKPRLDTPPAPDVPDMTLPDPRPKARPKVTAKVEKPAPPSPARKATTGPEVKAGDARVNTGAPPIPFGGLSTRSGGGTGGVQLDVGNFCCPEYIAAMQQRIRSNWNQNQGAAGRVIVKFTIQRDGTLVNIEVERPSNQYLLDAESRRVLLNTRLLPPLPAQFTEPSLTVHVTFDYVR